MDTIDQVIARLQEEDAQFIMVANPLGKESVFIDGREIDGNALVSFIRMGAYYMLPHVVYHINFTDWKSFETIIATTKNMLGYENQDIHLILDYNFAVKRVGNETMQNKIEAFKLNVQKLKDMGEERFDELFGGEIVEMNK